MDTKRTLALKMHIWLRRGFLFMVSPDSLGTACKLSGRNSTYRHVQISETSSPFSGFDRWLCYFRYLNERHWPHADLAGRQQGGSFVPIPEVAGVNQSPRRRGWTDRAALKRKCLGGLQIDYELALGCLHHRQVGGVGA